MVEDSPAHLAPEITRRHHALLVVVGTANLPELVDACDEVREAHIGRHQERPESILDLGMGPAPWRGHERSLRIHGLLAITLNLGETQGEKLVLLPDRLELSLPAKGKNM